MGKLIGFGIFIVCLYLIFGRSDGASNESRPETAATYEPAPDSNTFAGERCTLNCSGHEAGYEWAEERGINDDSVCENAGDESNSPSFAEGCAAYVNGDDPQEDKDNPDDQ